MLKKIFLIVIFFLYLFGVPFSFLPFNASKFIVVGMLIWCLLVTLSNKINSNSLFINKELFIVFLFVFSLTLISSAFSLLHGWNDFSLPYAYFIMLLEGGLGAYLFYVVFLNKLNFYEVLKLFVIVSFIQALIILLMLLSESFREFIYMITNTDAKELTERYNGFRGFGLAGSLTYDLSILLSIALMFISVLISTTRVNSIMYFFMYIVILIAAIMTGRTAWAGILFSLIIFFYNINNCYFLKKTIKVLSVFIPFSLFFLFLFRSFSSDAYNVFIDNVIPYAFEMFINFSETGEVSTVSSDKLQEMYFSISESTTLVGDGLYIDPYNEGQYYMSTDAGYMRHILFYGIFPSLMLYSFYLWGFYVIFKSFRQYKNGTLVSSLLCLYFFIAQYKGDFFTGSAINIKLFLILLVYSIYAERFNLNTNINGGR